MAVDSPDQAESGPLGGATEVRRSAYVEGFQYHVDFRDITGKVVRTLPAPAWAFDLYRMYLDAARPSPAVVPPEGDQEGARPPSAVEP